MFWSFAASLVGGTLLVAGVPKIREHESVLRAVRGYQLLPSALERVTARVLPYAETVVGALLVCGIAGRVAAAAATAMFLAFVTGLTVNLARGRTELDCGCFAFGSHDVPHIGWFHAARAAGFALVSLALVATAPEAMSVADTVAGAALAAAVLAGAFAAVQLRSVVHTGRRPIDEHLSRASIELRAASTISRYAP